MNATEYFANKSLSKSAIDLLLECPALYKAWLEDVEEQKVTSAMSFGSMFHMLCLEPEKFNSEYAVSDLSMATKEGKTWKSSLPEGVTVVKSADHETALYMADAVRDHPQAKFLFGNHESEKPVFWTRRDGIACKCKPDIISDVKGHLFLADLKTTESANPDAIQRSIAKYHYHRQAAWYLAGMEAIGRPCAAFVFIFVEKAYPHLVTMCQLDEAAIAQGMEECERAVSILKECRRNNIYPCYTREILTLSLPKWAVQKDDEYVAA